MTINNVNYNWKQSFTKRYDTKYIVLHHAAVSNASVESIHQAHISKGWSGIGYHFYVRKDGSIYKGRPIETVGAHCLGYNSYSIGICFEGNFENEIMTSRQLSAGKELIQYVKSLYPNAVVKRHKELYATACPGKNFPFDKLKNVSPKLETANDITYELRTRYFKIDDVDGFVKVLDKAKKENSPLYWGYYKLVNKVGV